MLEYYRKGMSAPAVTVGIDVGIVERDRLAPSSTTFKVGVLDVDAGIAVRESRSKPSAGHAKIRT